MACELFGYDETEMIGLLLKDLVKLKPKDQATILESHLELTGEVVDVAGKVVGISLLTSIPVYLVKLKPKDQATILESHLELTGEVVDIAGKVVGISLLNCIPVYMVKAKDQAMILESHKIPC